MIAVYSDREFKIWDYRVSHGSLLIRSPKGTGISRNVDLVFVGVDYMALPSRLHGAMLSFGTVEDRMTVTALIGDSYAGQVYVLVSEECRHFVVAAACQVDENDKDIFDTLF